MSSVTSPASLSAALRDPQWLASVPGEGQIVVNIHGQVVWGNEEFCRMMGWAGEQVPARTLLEDTLDWGNEVEDGSSALMDAMRSAQATRVELRRTRADGSHIWTDALCTPVEDDSGAIRYFLLKERDITERVNREQEREQQLVKLYKLMLETTQHEATRFPYHLTEREELN